jgi:hypothetical protein
MHRESEAFKRLAKSFVNPNSDFAAPEFGAFFDILSIKPIP